MLWLVRHGQTAANAAGLIQGRSDHALTDLGRRQAEALAARLPAGARVLSSPLSRARQTAAAAAAGAVEVDERWVELDYGELEGKGVADIRPALWHRWSAEPAWAPAGGESLAAVAARVGSACDGLADEIAAGEVVVVSHVGPIKAAVAWALGVGPETAWRMHVDPASITRIGIGAQGAPVLLGFNDTGHLAGVDPGRAPPRWS